MGTFNVTPLKTEIETKIRQGEHVRALTLIRTLKVKTLLSPALRLLFSDWYLRLGKPGAALKILGPEVAGHHLPRLDFDSLKVQARLGYMLSFFGATESALRILDRLEPVIATRDKDDPFVLTFYRYRADALLGLYDYSRAHKAYAKAYEVTSRNDSSVYQLQFISLGISDCLIGLGKADEAIRIATDVIESSKSDTMVLKAVAYQARGEYYFRQADYKNARLDFDTAWSLFPSDAKSRDYAFLAKWSGALSWIEGDSATAKKRLKIAADILVRDRARPASYLEVLYWQTKITPSLAGLPSHRVVRTHPCQSPFGYLLGRSIPDPAPKMDPWIRKQVVNDHSNNCWVLKRKSLNASFYQDEIIKWKSSSRNQIDLISGIIFSVEKKAIVLSALRTRCLMLLGCAGGVGINQWAMIDLLYPGSWASPESALLRLEDLIITLREKGFNIIRKKNTYNWEISPGQTVLLPMDLKTKDPFVWLSTAASRFTRSDIEAVFDVSPANAKIWIKSWVEVGKIQLVGNGKNTRYELIEQSS